MTVLAGIQWKILSKEGEQGMQNTKFRLGFYADLADF